MKEKITVNITQKASSIISTNNNRLDKYRALKKLMQIGPNNWPKFQEQFKKLASSEIFQTQTKQKESKTTQKISTENFISPTEIS